MRPLIIIARPPGTSHTRHGFEHLKTRLEERGIAYDTIDLYEEGFDPVMREKPTEKHTAQIERYRKLIDDTDRIIVLYPVWWNGPPAILKGFFDCTLSHGWAYHYQPTPFPKVGIPIGHMKGKRAAVISSSGALNILHTLVQHSRAGRIIAHDILRFAGMRSKRFNLGGCQQMSDANLRRMERMCDRALGWLHVR